MSEPIRWQTLTLEQRDVLIHEKVMSVTELNCTGKMIYDGEDADETPFFLCQQCGLRLLLPNYYDRGVPKSHVVPIPDYTRSRDAAWKVLLSAAYHAPYEHPSSLQRLAHELFQCGIDEFHDLNPYLVLGLMQGWTPEILCIACLRACGYEVINERS